MSILSLFAFSAFLVYLYLSIYTFRLDPGSRLNRTFSYLSLSFALWAFAYIFFYSAYDKETAWFWYKVSVAGWCFFPGISLHFFIILTENERLLKKRWIYLLLYLPGTVFTYKALTGVFLVEDFVRKSLGWCEVAPPASVWLVLYPLYYTSFILSGLLMTGRWGAASEIKKKKKQANVITTAAYPVLIIAAVTDTLLPFLKIQIFPSIASIFILLWVFGIWYSIVKYRLMILTPSIAAEEIVFKMLDLLVLAGPDGNITKLNRQAGLLLGYGEEELTGRPLGAIFSDGSAIRGELEKIKKDPEHIVSVELSYKTKEGGEIPARVSCSVIKDREGDIIGVVVVGQDLRQMKHLEREIMERAKAEETLIAAEAKFRSLVEQSIAGIYIIENGRWRYVNPKFAEIFGYSQEEIINSKTVLDLVAEESRELVSENIRRRLEGDIKSIRYSFKCVRKDGAVIDIESHGTMTELEGKPVIIGTLLDITERKRMEEEMLKAEKLESMGVLAGGIAHDFNNLLTGILGNISLSKMHLIPGDKILPTLIEAEKAAARAKSLTHQLLTFSKGGAPVKKVVSISDIIKDSADFALRGSNVVCSFSIPEDLRLAEVDEGQMTQVMHNLVINAQQSMPGGGNIHISCENITAGERDALPLKEGRYIRISIEDSGAGIPEENLKKIFDPYFTTKHKGSGLGLSTSYSIIKNHDGHIAVKSKQGSGTTFYIYIPASDKEKPEAPEQRKTLLRGKGRILVMDDEDTVRLIAGRMLHELGYEAGFAENGEKAIELYAKAKETGEAFDAVLIDLTVRGGMGGVDCMKGLIEIDSDIKAIVASGYSDDPVLADYMEFGFKGILSKPYHIEDLSEALHRIIYMKDSSE